MVRIWQFLVREPLFFSGFQPDATVEHITATKMERKFSLMYIKELTYDFSLQDGTVRVSETNMQLQTEVVRRINWHLDPKETEVRQCGLSKKTRKFSPKLLKGMI